MCWFVLFQAMTVIILRASIIIWTGSDEDFFIMRVRKIMSQKIVGAACKHHIACCHTSLLKLNLDFRNKRQIFEIQVLLKYASFICKNRILYIVSYIQISSYLIKKEIY